MAWLHRPDDAFNQLVWVAPATALGTPMVVRPGETVLFVQHGTVVGALSAGEHILGPGGGIPFLASITFESDIDATIVFVTLAEIGWFELKAPIGELVDPPTQTMFRAHCAATFSARVVDPERLITAFATAVTHAEVLRAIETLLGSVISTTTATVLEEKYLGAFDLDKPEIAREVAERSMTDVNSLLKSQGLEVVRFGGLHFTREPEDEAAIRKAASERPPTLD